ncbi:MAG: guanylate kinase, partial [Gemmatimonadales bacterium]
ATTRAPRKGERDGVDYHFLSREEFERRLKAGEFLEWAEYGGNLYGTLEAEVQGVLREGRHVVLDIEVQGARQIRQRRGNVVSIFILPPSADVLYERLGGRSSDHPEAILERIRRAREEVEAAVDYEYVVVNDDLERAVSQVAAIIDTEQSRRDRHPDLAGEIAALSKGLARIAGRLESEARNSG